jgi:hypothetical protein
MTITSLEPLSAGSPLSVDQLWRRRMPPLPRLGPSPYKTSCCRSSPRVLCRSNITGRGPPGKLGLDQARPHHANIASRCLSRRHSGGDGGGGGAREEARGGARCSREVGGRWPASKVGGRRRIGLGQVSG